MKGATDPRSRLALLRACLTVAIETMGRADDSYGVIGEFFRDRLREYLRLPWRETGIAPRVYYRDLLELATWEDYGLTDEQLGAWFRTVARDELLLVTGILRAIRRECLTHGFEYQAEEALTLLGELHVAKRSFALFSALASEMGSRHWRRVERMAEAALSPDESAPRVPWKSCRK